MIFKWCIGFTLALLHLIMEKFAHADVYYAVSLFTGARQKPIIEVKAQSLSLCSAQCLLRNCKSFSYSNRSCTIGMSGLLNWDGKIIVEQFRPFTGVLVNLIVVSSSTPSSSSYPAKAAINGASCVNGFRSNDNQSFLLVDLGSTYLIDNITVYTGSPVNISTWQAKFSETLPDPSAVATGSSIQITTRGSSSRGSCFGQSTSYSTMAGAPTPRIPGRYLLISGQYTLDIGQLLVYGFI